MGVKKRDNLSVSPWIQRFSHLVPNGDHVLDLAAGSGRHSAWFLDRGHHITALDRSIEALAALRDSMASENRGRFEIIEADLEDGSPWPLADHRFDAIVVVNYLHRPLFADLLTALRPGGVFLYDTFAVGNEAFGRPSNPDFLLQPGELLDVIGSDLHIVAYEHGRIDGTSGPAVKQRIAAIDGSAPVQLFPS